MARIERGNNFLSGFGNEDFLQDFVMGRGSNRSPIVNISENQEQYKVEMSVPGYEKDELSIRINQSTLMINGAHKAENGENEEAYTRREFDYSTFHKTFRLPEHVKTDHISARHKNGILEIIVPKDEKLDKESVSIDIR